MSVEFHYGTSSCAGIHSTKFTRSKSLFDIYIFLFYEVLYKREPQVLQEVLQLYKCVTFVPFLLKLITSK